jgi:hypothetical protein
MGEHLEHRASGLGVLDELDGALPEGRAVGVTLEHGLDDLRKAQSRLLEGLGDGRVRLGCGELRVASGQLLDTTFELFFASRCRHNNSLHYQNFGCSRCVALTIRTLAKLMVFLNQFTDGGL